MDNSAYSIPTKDLFKLQNRTILVSGGLGGVGSHLVLSILESGADVICLDLPEHPQDLERFHNVATENEARYFYYSVNVTDADQVSNVMEQAVKGLRYPLRGVVTTAGISGECDAVDYPAEDFRRVLDTNVMGTFLVVQAAARVMREQKSAGSVVLIASMSGSVANRVRINLHLEQIRVYLLNGRKGVNTAAYNSSKAAVQQLARSLAAEWGNQADSPPIRVNSISPGYIITGLSAGAMARPEVKAQWLDGSMLGRFSHPEEYRAPILFMLSDGSSFMTGADLKCDGGHTAW
ncbi:D-arabinitol 2-dehydrogenase [ribulose-forming] [Lachnellula occidentalis]|uniref:D-arabinitol 2-dehydrogenase [ribulose-forming] n=1 Tax=Lachnellula occidentalis TaxID=215460 RepID=A0A8H8S626_9HELO|nr:D-arabinitol 2-dehydrogenase [ribulose-forming] [Lachnellula occidentalis]